VLVSNVIKRLFPALVATVFATGACGQTKTANERIFQLQNPEGKVLAASLLEVGDRTVKLKIKDRVLSTTWDKFDVKHHATFEDFRKYQLQPFDLNQLADPAPEIQPGKIIEVAMPDLEKDAASQPAGYTLRVPENYHPWKSTPLIVWFAGGRGSRDVNQAIPLVDPKEFLIVCIPYPESEPRPLLAVEEGRGSTRLWAYHRPMLEDLKKRVPNISPDLRIADGMSNGAHTVGSYLGEGIKEFTRFFDTFLLIEGGSSISREYDGICGKRIYHAWGTMGSRPAYAAPINERLKGEKADVTDAPMQGVDHDFPSQEKAKCKSWILALHPKPSAP
jgi:hypothetical protein